MNLRKDKGYIGPPQLRGPADPGPCDARGAGGALRILHPHSARAPLASWQAGLLLRGPWRQGPSSPFFLDTDLRGRFEPFFTAAPQGFATLPGRKTFSVWCPQSLQLTPVQGS